MIQFISGSCVGFLQAAIGHPFDLLKVKCQIRPTNKNILLASFDKQLRSQISLNKFGYFRGLSVAIIGTPITSGFQFMTNDFIKRQLMKLLGISSLQTPQYALELRYLGLSGMLSGILTSFLLCPIQYAKINRQIGTNYQEGPFKIIYNNIKKGKGLRLFKGLPHTIFRQGWGGFAYFAVYQKTIRYLCEKNKQKRQLAGRGQFFIGGAAAGLAYWLSVYPIDLIKTRIQLRIKNQNIPFRGLEVALFRGAIVNAVSLLIYEEVKAYGQIVELIAKA